MVNTRFLGIGLLVLIGIIPDSRAADPVQPVAHHPQTAPPPGSPFRVTCSPAVHGSRSRGASMSCWASDQSRARAAVRARLVPARAIFRGQRRELEAGRAVANRFEGRRISRVLSTSSSPADTPSRPSSGSTSTRTRSATARGTPTARSSTPSSIPSKGGTVALTVDQDRSAPTIPVDRPDQAGRARPARSSRRFTTARSSTARR